MAGREAAEEIEAIPGTRGKEGQKQRKSAETVGIEGNLDKRLLF